MIEYIPRISEDSPRPFLSVVIPCYQNRSYVSEALSSVLRQVDLSDTEVFLVDDASPEGHPLENSSFVGKVPVFRQPKNLGHVGNLADCIRRARGRYVHLLHGDDYVLDGFYQNILDVIKKYPSAGAVFTQNVMVNGTGKWTSLTSLLQTEIGTITDLLQKLAIENVIQTPSIIVKREVYETIGAFDSSFTWCEDWEMWSRIASNYDVVYVPQALAAYRQHGTSSTSKHLQLGLTGEDTMRCLRAIWKKLPDENRQSIMKKSSRLHATRCLNNAAHAKKMAGVCRQIMSSLRFNITPLNVIACTKTLLKQGLLRLRA